MIVPEFWAAAKRKIRHEERSCTVHRFGWSDLSLEAAQEHAQRRVAEAVQQILDGEATLLREPKVPYNGADGLPIREEIVARRGDSVLTRNAYGALCLNTPGVLFADVDAVDDGGWWVYTIAWLMFAGLYAPLAWEYEEARSIGLFLLGSMLFVTVLGSAGHWVLNWMRVSPKQAARKQIERFSASHPEWTMRLYETPRGWRVLVTHSTFDPRGQVVRAFFQQIGADPIYVRMCFNQNCFRARVSPKPWRVGIDEHLKPRPGVWPVSAERMPDRIAWVKQYEGRCHGFASCRLEAVWGTASVCEQAAEITRWHDELAAASSGAPIA